MKFLLESEPPSWTECHAALEAINIVVTALVEFIQQHGSRNKSQDSSSPSIGHGNTSSTGTNQSKYKVSMCRNLTIRGSCPRASSCTFAHSELELEKYRAKSRKPARETKEKNVIVERNSKSFKGKDMNGFPKNHDTAHRESE